MLIFVKKRSHETLQEDLITTFFPRTKNSRKSWQSISPEPKKWEGFAGITDCIVCSPMFLKYMSDAGRDGIISQEIRY
jgi:hypothetical protein